MQEQQVLNFSYDYCHHQDKKKTLKTSKKNKENPSIKAVGIISSSKERGVS